MVFKHAIALTGGIASGKSTVVLLLKKEGFQVIDADEVAHDILESQQQEIRKMFGEDLVKEGKVDRKALGAVVFEDKKKLKMLEALLHPLIYKKIKTLASSLDKKGEPYLVDIPLFYESGRYAIEKVVLVYASKAQQIERLMLRDGFSEAEALARLAAQMEIEEKRKKARYIINNSGTMAQLKEEVRRVKNELLEKNI